MLAPGGNRELCTKPKMPKDTYTKRRKFVQALALIVLACIPLRLFCLDTEAECIRLFGLNFGFDTMFYPLFAVVGLLLFVIGMGMKKGRLFCSHLCPMHMFLEQIYTVKARVSGHGRIRVWLWALLFSIALVQVILSFFQPLSRQFDMVASGNMALMGTAAALFGGFMLLFTGYQERFCKKGCPYALIQMLLQSGQTRSMRFSNPEKTCTNCRGCDDICPFNLRPRFESTSPDCTNCNLCAEACTNELGQGNTLFHLVDPAPQA